MCNVMCPDSAAQGLQLLWRFDKPIQELDLLQRNTTTEIQSPQEFPKVSPHPVCLICIGNEELSHERRLHHVPRKDVLKKHVKVHFKDL